MEDVEGKKGFQKILLEGKGEEETEGSKAGPWGSMVPKAPAARVAFVT